MKVVLQKALSDVYLFCMGFVLGVTIDFVIDRLHFKWDDTLTRKTPRLVLGLVQLFISVSLIRVIELKNIDKRLFSMGLFSSQTLLINTVWISPGAFRKISS